MLVPPKKLLSLLIALLFSTTWLLGRMSWIYATSGYFWPQVKHAFWDFWALKMMNQMVRLTKKLD